MPGRVNVNAVIRDFNGHAICMATSTHEGRSDLIMRAVTSFGFQRENSELAYGDGVCIALIHRHAKRVICNPTWEAVRVEIYKVNTEIKGKNQTRIFSPKIFGQLIYPLLCEH